MLIDGSKLAKEYKQWWFEDMPLIGLYGRQNEEIDVTLVPSALPKKAIQIPVGFGMKLYLENRFMNMLFKM